MPDKSLVFDSGGNSAGTHAIVIGVGHYPHLLGGSGTLSPDNDGMGQLSSPPHSAFQFCDWLIRSFNNPQKPLASVSLLVSEKNPKPFINSPDGVAYQPVSATASNIAEAVTRWVERGDTDLENMLIFYFCGHGISAGTETALLASDYGAIKTNSLDGAIDLRRLILGLEQCQAAEQSFFIDACRSSSDTLITAQSTGRLIVQPRIRNPTWPPRKTSTFFATLKGDVAYGYTDKPTVFTKSLLDSFDKYAADNEEGDWRINTNRMADSLDHLIARQRSIYPGIAQVPESNDRSKFYLHYLNCAPEALVYLACDPPSDLHDAEISFTTETGNKVHVPRAALGASETELMLQSGIYNFSAVFPSGRKDLPLRYVSPVYRRITFK